MSEEKILKSIPLFRTHRGQTPDGQLSWFLVDRGTVVTMLFETALDFFLGENQIKVLWGRASKSLLFERQNNGHIMAKIEFLKEELRDLGPEEVPLLDFSFLEPRLRQEP